MNTELLYNPLVETIWYKETEKCLLRLLVVRPMTDNTTSPAVVWIHGGGWQSDVPERCLPQIAYFAVHGAVGISVEYRLANTNGTTVYNCVEDCIDAITYLHENASKLGIDAERITLCGDSAGGHLALCAGSPMITRSERSLVAGIVDCNGIVDLTMKWRTILPKNEQTLSSDTAKWLERYNRICSISPIYNVCPNNPPTLILHGLADIVVEPEEAARYYRELQRAGVDAELRMLPGMPHAFILFDYAVKNETVLGILEEIRTFLAVHGLLD